MRRYTIAGILLLAFIVVAATVSQQDARAWLFRETDNLATLLGYLIVSGASFVAFQQWRADQRWKQVDTLMQRIEAFGETPGVRNAMMMLSSHDRDIPLWDKERPEDRYERVTWAEVERALVPSNLIAHDHDPKQDAIRNSFEDFFGRLAHLELYLGSGLLREKEAEYVVGGWIRRLNALTANPTLLRNVRIYIEWRGMTNVQELFARFGLDLRKDIAQDQLALEREVAAGLTSPSTPDAHAAT